MTIPPGFSAADLRALARAKLAPELSPEAFARTSEPRVSDYSLNGPPPDAATLAKARPAAVKGKYVKRITVASTMSPGVDLDLVALDAK